MIFVDSNIPMYLIGDSAPYQVAARRLVEQAVARQERLVTSTEVMQEILHRYVAIARRDAIQPAFDVLTGIVDDIFPVDAADIEHARAIVLSRAVSARDAVHVAVMQRHGVSRIMSFDSHFDGIPGIERVPGC